MIETAHEWLWVWGFGREEKWLNQMAAGGLALHSAGFCRYDFEQSEPGEYRVCLELLSGSRAETENYIGFLEETGVEHVGNVFRWAYFRKKTREDFRLFSDNSSRIRLLTRVIRLLLPIMFLNLGNALQVLVHYFSEGNPYGLLGLINLALALLCAYGLFRLNKKRKVLKDEQQIFE